MENTKGETKEQKRLHRSTILSKRRKSNELEKRNSEDERRNRDGDKKKKIDGKKRREDEWKRRENERKRREDERKKLARRHARSVNSASEYASLRRRESEKLDESWKKKQQNGMPLGRAILAHGTKAKISR